LSSAEDKYVDVALPIPGSPPLTYSLPDQCRNIVQPGMRVKVPVATREMAGWVVKLRNNTKVAVKPIKELLDQQPCLDQEMLRLTAWVAEYYHCSWGEVIRTALPPGMTVKQHPVLILGEKAEQIPPGSEQLCKIIKEKGQVSESHALKLLGHDSYKKIKLLLNKGILYRKLTWQKSLNAKYQRWLVLVKTGMLPVRAAGQKALLEELVAKRELPSGGRLSLAAADALVEKGMARWESRQIKRLPQTPDWEQGAGLVNVSQDQRLVLQQISKDLREKYFRVNLVHGVTGSGKTELYLLAAVEAVKMGKSVLIMVPEIGLTAQMISRVKRRFPGAAVWHSGLGQGERLDIWESIKQAGAKVVVGTRSAVFAPLPDLGLIVVDEEQDASYKQSEVRPHYNARDVAIMRAKRAGATVILGSATPSVESYYKAVNGKFRLFSWESRAGTSALPRVRLVDTKSAGEGKSLITGELKKALKQTLDNGQQSMLLLNRRGYSPYVQCRQCGHIIRCPNCSISLTYHRPERRLLCHYCGHARQAADLCPRCSKPDLAVSGTAIQGLEDELKGLFPTASVLRMDADTTSAKDGHQRIIGKFMRKEASIMIGTQMISKGHDFSDVTLVGIINTDDLLGIPDFRAQERAFQLMTQMAGRSGRGVLPGQVILQTRDPRNPVVLKAQQHDYRGFWEEEIKEREEHSYPPFSRLALITITSPDESSGEEEGMSLAALLVSANKAQILGPVPAPVSKIKGRFRWQIVVKAKNQKILSECLDLLPVRTMARKVRVAIDVDPVALL
jgi:primosomal protein N' (replication factor Y)